MKIQALINKMMYTGIMLHITLLFDMDSTCRESNNYNMALKCYYESTRQVYGCTYICYGTVETCI